MEETPTYTQTDVLKKYIRENTKLIAECLSYEVEKLDYDGIQAKLIDLSQISANAAKAQAYAKTLMEQKKLQVISQHKDSDMPPSILSKLIDAEAFEEAGTYCYCERLSASVSHSIEALRSVLSWAKQEMINSNNQK